MPIQLWRKMVTGQIGHGGKARYLLGQIDVKLVGV